ncbi:MAG TPA: hypothetical protein PK771_09570 [Spirochaetota bacterium]|nr:hypothetical protein [Spirochaetota bacterium]
MKKIIGLIFLILFFIVINTLFFPVKIYKKTGYSVSNYFSLDRVGISENIEGFYYTESECVYFNFKDGIVNRFVGSENEFVEANKHFYVTYKKVGEKISLFNPFGKLIKEIPSFTYPYVTYDSPVFYGVKTNGSGFFTYNIQGDLLYSVDYTSVITSISTDKYANTLISLLDGKTFLYSPKQEVLFSTDSSDNNSKIVVAKSSTLDTDGQYIAICSGIDPEYVEIYQKKTNGRIKKIITDTNFRYQSFLKFNSGRLYYEGDEKLKYYDIKNNKESAIQIYGEILDVQFDNSGNIITLTNKDNLYFINIFYPNGKKIFYKEFAQSVNNIKVLPDNSFYFKLNDIVVKISSEKS